ncbi:MAG TPA: 50S ribosomal protein L25 [Trichormus sp.]|jgi:large subunit ribosomal protein L25
MEKIKLSVNPREGKTPNQLRREGIVPATLYGPGQPSESVQVDAREFGRLPSAAYSHMIELNIAGKSANAVIRDVQRRSTTHQLLHIEFYRVSMDRLLTMTVPLKFINTSPAAAEGGQLVEVFQSADIESLPGDIPEFIEVDLSVLKAIDDAIHFGDLKLAPTVKLLNPHDEIVAKVVAPRAAEEEAPTAAPAEAAAPAAETPEAAKEE